MNHIYKVIWSKAKHCYTVVSEIAKSQTRSPSVGRGLRSTAASLAAALAITGGLAFGMPAMVSAADNPEAGTPEPQHYIAFVNYKGESGSNANDLSVGTTKTWDGVKYTVQKLSYKDSSGKTITQKYWVRDGYIVSMEYNPRYDGVKKEYVIDAYKDPDYKGTDQDNVLKNYQSTLTESNIKTLSGSKINDINAGVYGGGVNGHTDTSSIADGSFVINTKGSYHQAKESEFQALKKDDKTGLYTYNGEVVDNSYLYAVNTKDGNQIGIFLDNGEIYKGQVFGNNNEVLKTAYDKDTGKYYSYWAAEIKDPTATIGQMQIGEFNKILNDIGTNIKESQRNDVKSIQAKASGNNGGTIGLEINNTFDAEGNAKGGKMVPGTISFTSTGGIGGKDVSIKVGQVGDDGTTITDKFTLAAGSKVTATNGSDGKLSSISVNGTSYTVPQGKTYTAGANVAISDKGVISATDTNTTYTAGDGLTLTGTIFAADPSKIQMAYSINNATTKNQIALSTGLTFKQGSNVTITDDAKGGITISSTDTDTYVTKGEVTTANGKTVLRLTKNGGAAIADIDLGAIKGTSYTAGNGINPIGADNTISVKAGNGVTVDNNGVSVKAGKNIQVDADGVALKDDVTGLTSVQSNAFKVGTETYISSSGLNANNKVISNVAAGKEDTDAVNVSQLNAAKTTLTIGDATDPNDGNKNFVITDEGKNGNHAYKLNLSNEIRIGQSGGKNAKLTMINSDGKYVDLQIDGSANAIKTVDGKNVVRVKAVNNAGPNTLAVMSDGLKFIGDNYKADNAKTVVTKKLNETLSIKGGKTDKDKDGKDLLTKNNIGVVAEGNNLTVKLAKDVDLGKTGSLSIGNLKANADSLSIGGLKATSKLISLDNNQFAAGYQADDTDKTGKKNGYYVDGLSNTTWDGKTIDENRAATEGQLKKVADSVTTITNSALKFKGNGNEVINRKAGETLTIKGGKDVSSWNKQYLGDNVQTYVDTKTGTIGIALNKDSKYDSITLGKNNDAEGKGGINGRLGFANQDGSRASIYLDGNPYSKGVKNDVKTRFKYQDEDGKMYALATTADGMKFTGDTDSKAVTKTLSETLTIKGGARLDKNDDGQTYKYLSSANNVGVIANGSDLTIRLAQDINLGTGGSLKLGIEGSQDNKYIYLNGETGNAQIGGIVIKGQKTGAGYGTIQGLSNTIWNSDIAKWSQNKNGDDAKRAATQGQLSDVAKGLSEDIAVVYSKNPKDPNTKVYTLESTDSGTAHDGQQIENRPNDSGWGWNNMDGKITTGISLGKNSIVDNLQGRKAYAGLLGNDSYTSGIAIGENSYSMTGSVNIGIRNYHSAMGDISFGSDFKSYDGYKGSSYETKVNTGVDSTTIGSNSYSGGMLSTMIGSHSIMTNRYYDTNNNLDVTNQANSMQNFGAVSVGSLNSIESYSSSNSTSGIANSIVGLANKTNNSNGSLIFGAGNEITNSIGKISDPSSANQSVAEIANTFRKGAAEKAGGAVMAIGGGNKADYALYSQIMGVGNTLTGTKENAASFNLLDGYNNTVVNSRHTNVIGSGNTVTDSSSMTVIGDNHNVKGEHTIIIGSADEASEKAQYAKDAVMIGHNAEAGNTSVAIGVNANAAYSQNTAVGPYASVQEGVGNSTALGYGSQVGTRDIIAEDSNDGVISVGRSTGQSGEAGFTRRIINVKAGVNDTDAVNVSQLKKEIGETVDKGFGIEAEIGGAVQKKLGETISVVGDKNVNTSVVGGKIQIALENRVVLGDEEADQKIVLNGNEGRANIGGVVIGNQDGGNYVTSLDNKTWNGTDYVSGRGATEDQLKALEDTLNEQDKGNVKYDKNKDGSINYDSVTFGGTEYTGLGTDGVYHGGTHVYNVAYASGQRGDEAVNVDYLNDKVTEIEMNTAASEKHIDTSKEYTVDSKGQVKLDEVNGHDKPTGNQVIINDVASKAQQDKNTAAIGKINDTIGVSGEDGLKDDYKDTNYLKDSNTLVDADKALDAAIKQNSDRISNVEETAKKHTTVTNTDKNITIQEGTNDKGGTNYELGLNNDKITLGNDTNHVIIEGNQGNVTSTGTISGSTVTAGKSSMTDQGISYDGKTYISADGLNANDKKVINVAAGDIKADSKDAVNGSQLYTTNQQVINNSYAISNVAGSVSRLSSRVNQVGAGAAALAALHPLDFDPDDKWDFAAGYGNYAGANAVALGMYYRPNEDTMFSIGGSMGGGENMVNASVSFKLGQGNNVSTSRVAMAKEIKDLRKELEEMRSLLADTHARKPIDPSKLQLFPDVPANHWAYEYIAQMAGNGILEGYPDGNFRGDRPMTRYEFAAMLYRAMENGARLSDRLLTEFAPELERFTVDTVAKDKEGNPTIQRVRVVKGK